jgi:hypothetical protein
MVKRFQDIRKDQNCHTAEYDEHGLYKIKRKVEEMSIKRNNEERKKDKEN